MKLFLVCDIDKTLIPFHHDIAMYRLQKHLKSLSLFSADATLKISDFVTSCYTQMCARASGEPHEQRVVQQLEEMAFLVENHENADVSWSRELWLYAASSLAGRVIPSNVAQDAAMAYWEAIGQFARPYEDVQNFFESEWWYKTTWELVLVTSSDARLCVASNASHRLCYDPEYSMNKKLERIPRALRQWSLPNGIFVGDPVGKPDTRFWKLVTDNICYDPKEDIAVMVGDSAAADLANLPEGFISILIDRSEEKGGDVKEAQIIIHGLDSLPIILENLESKTKKRG